VIVFLQNAWSPVYAGGVWPRESWLTALKQSRSGKRLKRFVPDPRSCHNTTPLVGSTPGSKLPPDLEHMRAILEEHQPCYVVACGKQAEAATLELRSTATEEHHQSWHLLIVPHPTSRVVTNALYERARVLLSVEEFTGVIALRQLRGSVEEVQLEG